MPAATAHPNLVLIGFMGSGKSAVGRLVADRLRFDFVDTDALIEQRAGKPIARIFAEEGEAQFRGLEAGVVTEAAGWHKTVISAGGGLGANAAHLASLRAHALIICLWASPEVLWERMRRQTHRPLLRTGNPLARIRDLLEQRAPVYRQADVLINTEQRAVPDVAQQVVHHYEVMRKHRRAP